MVAAAARQSAAAAAAAAAETVMPRAISGVGGERAREGAEREAATAEGEEVCIHWKLRPSRLNGRERGRQEELPTKSSLTQSPCVRAVKLYIYH